MLRNVVCFQVTHRMISFIGVWYVFCSGNLNMFLMVTTIVVYLCYEPTLATVIIVQKCGRWIKMFVTTTRV